MKYQKNIPATKPNIVQIPDQKTLTANARVIMKKKDAPTRCRSIPLHGV